MVHPLIPTDTPPTFVDGSYQLFLLDRKVQRLSPRTIDFYADHMQQIPGHAAITFHKESPRNSRM